jgi:hypothetical protein
VIARSIYRNPIPFLLFMPIFCIFLIGFGFSGAEIEDSVSELWARKDSQYYHDLQYREKVRKNDKSSGGGNSGALVIAIPRKGSNVMSSDYLAEIEARMNETENIKVRCFFIQYVIFSVIMFKFAHAFQHRSLTKAKLTPLMTYVTTPLDLMSSRAIV